MSDFRFSPRANRASDIGWMAWDADAFERARTEDKPILLSISAVWCHWCHVMDETSYSDPGVIAAINERFVPIRVDNDRRPDVNARYNMGGWPTTAFLAPDGSTLTGATYLPPDAMRRALDEIAQFYAGNKAEITARTAAMQARSAGHKPSAAEDLRDSMIVALIEEVTEGYDDEYGGFGDAPKFPQPELLEFLLTEWRLARDQRLYAMVARTMLGMSRGGTYDHVEGGFFRYSTTRDWSVPHFEKMAEEHAGLLRVLAQLALFAPTDEFHATLASAVGYVRSTLRDPGTGFFAGSQDADEEYFALPLDERRSRTAPYVDRTSYTNWTCALAGAWFLAAIALDDDVLLREASQTLDSVHARLMDPDGLAYHFIVPGGTPQVRGLLTDQAAYLRALLDAHEVSGEARFIERARTLADRIVERFEAEGGGFYDHLPLEVQLGRLEIGDRPIVDNGLLADALLRLSALTGGLHYRTHAERALALYAGTYAAAGSFAATYGRALRRYLSPEVSVRIVGEAAGTAGFREAALRLPTPMTAIRTIGPEAAAELGLPPDPHPAAYVCAGTVCGAPARDPAGLRAAYDRLGPP
ncbi:MAG: DUF255 domain-containing protein [Candidatus Tumulicola sp.]